MYPCHQLWIPLYNLKARVMGKRKKTQISQSENILLKFPNIGMKFAGRIPFFFLLPGTFSVTTWTICGSDFHDPSHFFLNQFSGISKIRLFKTRVNLSPPSQSFHWRQNTKLVYSLPLHLHQEHFDLCGFRQQEMGISDNYGSHTWMCQNESIVISVEVTHRLIPLLPR